MFFEARQTQAPGAQGQFAEYKGYPARDAEIPVRMAKAFREHGLIDDEVYERLRAARRAAGRKT